MTTKSFWARLAAIAIAVCAASTAAAQSLTAELSAEKGHYGPAEGIVLRLTLRNAGDTAAAILLWELPFDGIKGDLFAVTRDGARARYTGRLYKRPAPTAADWVRIPAGGELSGIFDLAGAYDLAAGGSCTARFRLPPAQAVAKGRAAVPGTVYSNAVAFTLERRAGDAVGGEDWQAQTFALTPSFRSCTARRQKVLRVALAGAQDYASEAYGFLSQNPRATPRYRRWFGAFAAGRHDTVTRHFKRLQSAIETKRFVFDCSCTESAYAFVYPTRPYRVWLCRSYWSAPSTGEDSKAGTLIHETSHFEVVAKTSDWIYGSAGARWLARAEPALAVFNADNHEYFCELR
jgi:peptidyl-Lys metalloendopeptidase